ncbi:alpha/beta hydrolase [Actinosynnema sp. NPDC050436]|uniref:alpha/beta fold hydrolase n=1 Tax=Actinosynnema sp. NPDC050436 TaxID=3155659 RepID=UPI0033FC2382
MDTGEFASAEAEQRYRAVYREVWAGCPRPDEELDVPTSFGPTRVYRFGAAGAPLVLLTGMAATAAGWGADLARYSAGHTAYAVDTLGEPGLSVQTAPIRDAADRGRWVDEVVHGLGVARAHLVGASTGGWHAAAAAVHAPGRIASVSLLDPTATTVGFGFGVLWRAAFTRVRGWEWFLRWAGPGEDYRLVLAGIREYRARPAPQVPHGDALRGVRVPVLALFGRHSPVHDAERAARRMRELVPHAEVEVWDCGHRLDAAGRVARFVARSGA